ncbi:MAG TPA: hypothetical protein DIT13_06960 [Verrucomicrobiales bacterium]|nr:hypothetical protein [Verrucomicrobiales bacterium]HRJ10751.1 PEP-CTERM sorting domain-containing protein [Prosthecobacter sp.]HRK13176.1 PEP-CTERM sorting domain-containing protein [Prosthecobacter sp.]
MRISIASALFLAAASFGHASITINFGLGGVYTAGGGSQIAAGTIGVLVADTTGAGFAQGADLVGSTLSVGSSLGTNGRILGVLSATNNLFGSGIAGFDAAINITDPLLSGLTFGTATNNAGSDLMFYWFPGITSAGSTITEGQSYGSFREDSLAALAGSASDMSFNLPANSDLLGLYANTINTGGDLPNDTFQANSTAGVAGVPEPSRMILALLGFAGLMFRRRR